MRLKDPIKKEVLILGAATVMLLCAFGAALPKQTLDPGTIYRRDIQLTVNGKKGNGVMVVPRASTYAISGTTTANMDLLTINTCHRDVSQNGLNKDMKYTYVPAPGIEDIMACPMEIGGYDEKGQHAWGMIEFEDPTATLPALLKCNGEVTQFNGVSICQSRQGLIQEIDFAVAVKVSPDPQCSIPTPADGKTFQFVLPYAVCTFAFKAIDGRIHRLTTVGYKGVLFREGS